MNREEKRIADEIARKLDRRHFLRTTSAAVNCCEGFVLAAAVMVYGSCKEFFSCTRLSQNQYCGIVLRNTGGHLQHSEQPFRPADNAFETVALVKHGAKIPDLIEQILSLHGPMYHQFQSLIIDRLCHIVIRSGLHGFYRGLDTTERGDHDHRRLHMLIANAAKQFHAAHTRHS
jgi:hypothetical protein